MIRLLTAGLFTLGLPIAACVAAASDDPQHAALSALAGHWEVKQSFYAKPGTAPQIDRGEADFAMVLNGRHLRQSLRIASSQPFEGLSYMGYDTAAGHYFSTWMDVNFSGLIVAWGDFDSAGHTYTLTGAMADPAGKVPVREVLHVADADHFDYEFYEAHDGKEMLAVRLDYTRRH